jgi:hypothetical protein
MKAYWGSAGIAPRILDLGTRYGGKCSDSHPGRFIPKEGAPGTHWIECWVGLTVGLDTVVNRKIPSHCAASTPHSSSP